MKNRARGSPHARIRLGPKADPQPEGNLPDTTGGRKRPRSDGDQQGAEDGLCIKTWKAAPHNRGVLVNERRVLPVADDTKVLESHVAVVPRKT